MGIGYVLGAIGGALLAHAAYATIQYRSVLKITEEEFSSPPVDVIIQLLVGLALCMWAGVSVPAKFHSVLPHSEENRMEGRHHLLDVGYDKEHRGWKISIGVEEMKHLRIRGHKLQHDAMKYDDRYTEYIERAKLLPFVTMARRGLPIYNSCALTTLVDRWHVETHTFHLPCGEMTVTLEDWAMITGLPLDGNPVTGKIEAHKFRDMVEQLLGVRPPDKVEGQKGSKTGGLKTTWLQTHFRELPEGADDVTVQRYARAYIMWIFGKVLFPDSGGSDVSWMYLPLLREWDEAGRYSWGSASLAYLYRQLDEACRRSKGTSNMGGCVLGLQVWMWERLPVGRPPTRALRAWPHAHPGMAPTVTHKYEDSATNWGPSENLYSQYTDEIDSLLPSHVTWRPYAEVVDDPSFNLNEMCTRDKELWTLRCPLICFYAVEYHLPHRVAKQFGKLQHCPPESFSTSRELHELDRSKNKKITDWEHQHREYISEWHERKGPHIDPTPHNALAFDRYLAWLNGATRLHLRKAWTERDILDSTSDSADDTVQYDYTQRKGKRVDLGPVRDRVANEIKRGITDAEIALTVTPGSEGEVSTLRACLQKMVNRSRKLVSRLACRDPTEDLDEVQPSSRENSASSEWDLDVEDLYDDQTMLSQVRGAPAPSQMSPGPSQQKRKKKQKRQQPLQISQENLRRGSRNRKPVDLLSPGTEALGKRKARK